MTMLQTIPLAVLIGLLFNANPSCGSGTLLWVSTQPAPSKMAALALTRIAVLAAVGALAGLFSATLRRHWGLLLIVAGIYLLHTTLRQNRMPGGACEMPRNSSALPGLLALMPPPSRYIGLAIFYGWLSGTLGSRGCLDVGVCRRRAHAADLAGNLAAGLGGDVAAPPGQQPALAPRAACLSVRGRDPADRRRVGLRVCEGVSPPTAGTRPLNVTGRPRIDHGLASIETARPRSQFRAPDFCRLDAAVPPRPAQRPRPRAC